MLALGHPGRRALQASVASCPHLPSLVLRLEDVCRWQEGTWAATEMTPMMGVTP